MVFQLLFSMSCKIEVINYLCPVPFLIFRIPTSEFMIPYTLNHLVPATSDLTGFRIWDLFDLGFEIADFGLWILVRKTFDFRFLISD